MALQRKGEKDVRLERLRSRLLFPMAATAAVLLICLVMPLVADINPSEHAFLLSIEMGAWLIFVVEYGVRLFVAKDVKGYIKDNILDLGVIVLLALSYAMPWSGPFLAVQIVCAVLIILDISMDLKKLFSAEHTPYALAALVLSMLVMGAMEYHFEHAAQGANITSLQDGWWWAFVSATTVGYGDKYPVTEAGRLIAVLMIMFGVACLALLTAALTSWMQEPTEEELAKQIEEENARVSAIVEAQILAHIAPIQAAVDQILRHLQNGAAASTTIPAAIASQPTTAEASPAITDRDGDQAPADHETQPASEPLPKSAGES